ncbi:hypothetical protein ACHAWF_004975 [Thalassiosira exigua]
MDLIVGFPRRGEECDYDEYCDDERRVSFLGKTNVKIIDNLATEHKADLWFTQRDINSFKERTILMLRALYARGMTVAQYADMNVQDTSAFMGLESHLTDITFERIVERRRRIAHAVISEQRRQDHAGVYDPITMSKISEAESNCSRKRARIIGLIHTDKR